MIDAVCRSIPWSHSISADEFVSADCAVAHVDAVFTFPGRHGESYTRRVVNSVAARKRTECRSLLPADERERAGGPMPARPPRLPACDTPPPGISGTATEPPKPKPILGR